MVLTPFVANAQDDGDTADDETEDVDEYVQGCAECHIDVVADWQETPHAMALGEGFQAVWNEDTSCLSCHATGYQAFSGEFTHAGVTCESCHGETPANHPDEPVSVSDGIEMCATCHTTTYHEWEGSPHGAQDLPCTACHNPHAQELRFETSTLLCTNCHEDAINTGFAHVSHTEQACSDCHWHRGEFDSEAHYATGQLFHTGHDAMVETLACTDCHEQDETMIALQTSEENGEVELIMPGADTRVLIRELEAEVDSVRAQGENAAATHLMQGGALGLSVGAIVAFLFFRLRPGSIKAADDEEAGA